MSRKSPPRRTPLSSSELQFWQRAFLAAELTVLLKRGGSRMNPAGAAHLASEYANAAVSELRRVSRQ